MIVKTGKVAFFGPWIGEFGWEVMTWQSWCRKKAEEYEKVYVCSFRDMEPLYKDFATFVPLQHEGRALDWHKKENYEKAVYEMPRDVNVHIPPFKDYRAKGMFIRFGNKMIPAPRFLVHARGINKGGKNYPLDRWEELVSKLLLMGPVACIGTAADHLILGNVTSDLRDIDLSTLMDYMAGCEYVIGQSSGVMHLACLCGPRVIAWGDDRTYFNETLDERYTFTWNPLQAEVAFITDPDWNPEPTTILDCIAFAKPMVIEKEPEEVSVEASEPEVAEHHTEIVQKEEPDALILKIEERIEQALDAGRLMLTFTYKKDDDNLEHHIITNNFPLSDILPSFDHLKGEARKHLVKRGKVKIKSPKKFLQNVKAKQTGVDSWK